MLRHNNIAITDEGGIAISLINDTGAASIKGTVVETGSVSESFAVASADDYAPIGVVYEDGVADGARCLVVMYGMVDVLLMDATVAVYPGWVRISETVAGRADATDAGPPGGTIAALEGHMHEIGHTLEAVAPGGADQVCRIMLHFN